jgi:hypothetical protein
VGTVGPVDEKDGTDGLPTGYAGSIPVARSTQVWDHVAPPLAIGGLTGLYILVLPRPRGVQVDRGG